MEEQQKRLSSRTITQHYERENMHLYLVEITHAQEKEREHIARELHDGILQDLASLSLDIEKILLNKDKENLILETVAQLEQLLDRSTT